MTAEYLSDRAHFPSRLSNELRNQILHYGPCRPKGRFLLMKNLDGERFQNMIIM